jgi:hypothetical protein
MDDETRRAIEAIVGAAKAEIVKIIESSKTPEEARIVVNEGCTYYGVDSGRG